MSLVTILKSAAGWRLEQHTKWEPPGGSGVYRRRLLVWSNVLDRRRCCRILVCLDGQNVFAFGKSLGEPHWSGEEQLSKYAPPNTVFCAFPASSRRYQEYVGWSLEPGHYSPSGERHAEAVMSSLLPYLLRRFPRGRVCGLLGASAGGVAALYTGWRFPGRLPAVACLSAGRHYFGELLTRSPGLPSERIFLSCGDSGMDREFVEQNRWFAKKLRQRGAEVDLVLHRGEHTESVWGRRLPRLLERLLDR